MDQARLFEETVRAPRTVVYLSCPLEVLKERLLSRALHEKSAWFDDETSVIEKRFQTFESVALEVIKHYQSQEKVVKIDGAKDVELVAEEVLVLVKDNLQFSEDYFAECANARTE